MTYVLSSAGLWVNRANTAWGASRQYNVGSSFEQDSATWHSRADTAYASGTWGSGPTWQANANQVYGPSRVYGSGNSFETNYNNLLNGLVDRFYSGSLSGAVPVAASATTVVPFAGPSSDPLGWGSGAQITCPKTGLYDLTIVAQPPGSGSNGGYFYFDVFQSGTRVLQRTVNRQAFHGDGVVQAVYHLHGVIAAGTTFQVKAADGMDGTFTMGGQVYIAFIPTTTYPS